MWLYTNWNEEDVGHNSGCCKLHLTEYMSAGQPKQTDLLSAALKKVDQYLLFPTLSLISRWIDKCIDDR